MQSSLTNLSFLLPPRVLKIQQKWEATEKLLENIELMQECSRIWAQMHRESCFETPLYRLICAAEQEGVRVRAEQKATVQEMLSFLQPR